jgi:hypothetical protein
MAWSETSSRHFTARHEEEDRDDVVEVLELLESTRERMAAAFPSMPGPVDVVVHRSNLALVIAQPMVAALRRATAPAARRYIVGLPTRDTIHVLSPAALAARASRVSGSRETELMAPAALYAQIVVGHNNRSLPPPFRPSSVLHGGRWAWLVFGAGQWFSGQTPFIRPALARRMREGSRPAFPPSLRDAPLLGGSLVDLVACEQGDRAVVELACQLPPGGPDKVLSRLFDGRPLADTENAWRSHVKRLAAVGDAEPRARAARSRHRRV